MQAPSTEAADSRIGTVLNERWTLERLIGTGGTAAVYSARHRNGKQVAVKVLRGERTDDPERVQRFVQEGYAANAVGHPAVVAIDDDGVDEAGHVFLVMELLDGESLADRLERDGPFHPEAALAIAAELLDALAAVHDAGIVHRDIKPGNLFLQRDGTLKILDFGVARLRDELKKSETATGTLLGTPAYMAPEQARGRWEQVDVRTDLWAVGATLFTLLSGEHVHESETANEQIALTMTTPARSLRAVCPDLSADLVGWVDRALEYEPTARWTSAVEMGAELQRLRGRSETKTEVSRIRTRAAPGYTGEETRAARSDPRSKSGRRTLVVAGAFLAVIAVGAGYVVWPRPAPAPQAPSVPSPKPADPQVAEPEVPAVSPSKPPARASASAKPSVQRRPPPASPPEARPAARPPLDRRR